MSSPRILDTEQAQMCPEGHGPAALSTPCRHQHRQRLVGLGVLVGAGVSVWASQFVATLLYGLEPHDPVTLAGASLVLAAVAAVAGWLPAWNASQIDPAEVLRES